MTRSPEEQRAERDADRYRDLVLTRTGLQPRELVCPREKSDMTPCLARDGHLVVVFSHYARGGRDHALCVGCEASLDRLLTEEEAKHA